MKIIKSIFKSIIGFFILTANGLMYNQSHVSRARIKSDLEKIKAGTFVFSHEGRPRTYAGQQRIKRQEEKMLRKAKREAAVKNQPSAGDE